MCFFIVFNPRGILLWGVVYAVPPVVMWVAVWDFRISTTSGLYAVTTGA